MKAIRCVLFDLDGTLVDTAPDLARAANLVRADRTLPKLPLEHYRPVASAGARGLLGVALGIDDAHPDYPQARASFLRHYRAELCRDSRLFPGMSSALDELDARKVRWGVVTNKPEWLAEPLLLELALRARLACLVGASDGLPPKPAPDPLLKACALLGLHARDCVYVGDDRRDVDSARAAGMPAFAAAWGYIGADDPPATWNADVILESPSDLMRHV